jgi:hypothetical protein
MEGCWNVQTNNRYPAYPRLEILSNAGSNNTLTSDYWVIDASYLKVRNIQFGYTVPKKALKSIGVENLRVYLSLDNPIMFKSFRKGWDPENVTADASYNNGQYYPIMSTYTLGLTLNF